MTIILESETQMKMSTDEYPLARGYVPSARLNLQYYLWQEALGYKLHPAITIKNDGWKVADVGTGTGIWLCDLTKHVPLSSQLDGFDISSDQFPHSSCLPQNVTLRKLDAMSSPPDTLCGMYDVVHVRLLFGVIKQNDPTPVLKHCMKLLKPGGYLQWDEMDPNLLHPLPRVEKTPTVCLEALVNIWKNANPIGWISQLPQIFGESGLDLVAAEAYNEREWQRHMWMELWCLTADDRACALDQTGPAGSADKVRQLASGAYLEITQGAYFSHTLRVAVGRLVGNDSDNNNGRG
ncbi:hypothetical protein MMC11_007923 [Xylographa trunciseda]|nr:hypothetical protein [Xylographa trunciseda]